MYDVASSDSSMNTSLGSATSAQYSPEKAPPESHGHGRTIESTRVKLREMGLMLEREEQERQRRLAELRGSFDNSQHHSSYMVTESSPPRSTTPPPSGYAHQHQYNHAQNLPPPPPQQAGQTTQHYTSTHGAVNRNAPQNSYSMSKNILMIDPQGVRMEPLQDLLSRYEKSGGQAASIARTERGASDDFALNSVCSPASFKVVDSDKQGSPVDGNVPLAGQVVDYLQHKFRKDPRLNHENPDRFANWVLRLCTEFSAIVREEPVYLRLQSPTYILGDIHGNFSDLNYYLTQLVPFGHLKYCSNQFLFLGDYVDRGAFGVEVVACLFALKCLSPHSVWLLRGNHELFTINGDQQHYGEGSFKTQCLRRFGPQLGDDVWVAVNEAFKLLPLAASIDDKIFCVHGGIPRFKGGDDIRMRLLSDPNFPRFNSTHPQAGDSLQRKTYREIAMDLLWSDPSDDEIGLDEYGFGPNARGPNTYTFGNKAIDDFLVNHSFEYIVRAHELKQDGLRICKYAKVLTVFTSSGYCGGDNSSGAVFVGNGKMRLISISTQQQGLNHAFMGGGPTTTMAPPTHQTATSPHSHTPGNSSSGRTSPTAQTRERPAAQYRDNSMGPTGRAVNSRSTVNTSPVNRHPRPETDRDGAVSPTSQRRSPPRGSPTPSRPATRTTSSNQRATSSSPTWTGASGTGVGRNVWH